MYSTAAIESGKLYLAYVDFAVLIIVISFHEALLQFGEHGV
jgi:hypothetical protein